MVGPQTPPTWKLDLKTFSSSNKKQVIPRNMSQLKSERIMSNLLKEIYNMDYADVKSISVNEKILEPGDVTGNLSESSRVIVSLAMNDGGKVTYNWFVKIMPKQHKNSELMNKFNIFENEISFYTEIAPDLLKFLNDNGIEDVEFDIPKVLFAENSEDEGAMIILEDVSEQGYAQARDEHGGRYLTLEKAGLAIDAIAKIHAASKLYNVQKDTKLEEKHATLGHNQMWEDNNFIDKLSAMKDSYCEVLSRSPSHDSLELMDRFKETFDSGPRLKSICAERYNPEHPGAVYLQHGDFHFNNLLFKEEEGKPTRVMIVDWQLTYSGRSTGDVSYLLMSSIRPDIRQDHGQLLKEDYFNSLNAYLKTYGSSIFKQRRCIIENDGSDVEVDVEDLEHDFHDSAPLSFFLSCGNVLSSDSDRDSASDVSDDEWENATVTFAYNLVKEAAEMEII